MNPISEQTQSGGISAPGKQVVAPASLLRLKKFRKKVRKMAAKYELDTVHVTVFLAESDQSEPSPQHSITTNFAVGHISDFQQHLLLGCVKRDIHIRSRLAKRPGAEIDDLTGLLESLNPEPFLEGLKNRLKMVLGIDGNPIEDSAAVDSAAVDSARPGVPAVDSAPVDSPPELKFPERLTFDNPVDLQPGNRATDETDRRSSFPVEQPDETFHSKGRVMTAKNRKLISRSTVVKRGQGNRKKVTVQVVTFDLYLDFFNTPIPVTAYHSWPSDCWETNGKQYFSKWDLYSDAIEFVKKSPYSPINANTQD